MKLLRFLLEKIVIVEVMLIILFLAKRWFGVTISMVDSIVDTSLFYLTPIAIVALVLYIIVEFLNSSLIKLILGIVIGGLILYYLYFYVL